MKFPVLFILLLICHEVFSQPNQCRCAVVFKEATEKTEQVYAGFRDKVNEKSKAGYEKRKASYGKFAMSVHNMLECHQLIVDFLDFYQDNHIFLQYSAPGGMDSRQILKIDDKEIKNLIRKDAGKSELAGIWESADKKYRFAVVPYKTITQGYSMLTLQHPDSLWPKGTVKAVFTNLKGEYPSGYLFHDDFYLRYTGFAVQDGIMELGQLKLFKQNQKGRSEAKEVEIIGKEVSITSQNDSTVSIRIPLFMQADVKKLDSLLSLKKDIISGASQIIIDIRGNGGGDASPPNSLLQILGIDTLKSPYWDYRAGKPYLARLESRLKAGRVDSVWYNKFKNAQEGYWREPAQTIRLDSVLRGKRKIALLINEGCASASEMFIYYAKQSKQVKLYGTHTSGTMDYGPTDNFPLKCKNFDYFGIPYGRNGWVDSNPIDKKGFQPDVAVASNVNQIEYILKLWAEND